MRPVQVTKAKAHLGELLRNVENGETIVITRHGKTVARLVPPDTLDAGVRGDAVDHFLQQRASWRTANLSVEEVLSARHKGHRA